MTRGPVRCHTKGTQDKRPMETLTADVLSLLADLEDGLDPDALAFEADDDLEEEV